MNQFNDTEDNSTFFKELPYDPRHLECSTTQVLSISVIYMEQRNLYKLGLKVQSTTFVSSRFHKALKHLHISLAAIGVLIPKALICRILRF